MDPQPLCLADLAAAIAAAYPKILPLDFLRYLLIAGGVYIGVNVVFSGALSGRKIRIDRPDGAQMRREFAASLRTVALFAAVGAIFVVGGQKAGLIRIDALISARGLPYFLFDIAALIVLHDAWFYWTHRLLHHRRLFRRLHLLHHRSHNPSPWTAYAFSAGEALVNALFLPVALIVLPSSGAAIGVFLLHMMVRNAIGHCGYEIFPSRRTGAPALDWMTTVTHHDLHHAQPGWNYGLYFTWWDRLMGTEHPRYKEKFAQAVRKSANSDAVAPVDAA